MTYIGSVREADKSMGEERRMEQERIQGFSPEGDDRAAQDCADAFGSLAAGLSAIGAAMNAAQQDAALPYLVVPRVQSEEKWLREKVAALEAQIAALTASEPSPVPNPMTRAVSLWPGSQGFIQGIRWRGGV